MSIPHTMCTMKSAAQRGPRWILPMHTLGGVPVLSLLGQCTDRTARTPGGAFASPQGSIRRNVNNRVSERCYLQPLLEAHRALYLEGRTLPKGT